MDAFPRRAAMVLSNYELSALLGGAGGGAGYVRINPA